MIQSICTRAKKAAVKRQIQTREVGLTRQDLVRGVQEEFQENEDLPNTTNPDDWAKIAGRRSERIVAVRPLPRIRDKQRTVETGTPGHYL
jgi:proteasome-associated ATPase